MRRRSRHGLNCDARGLVRCLKADYYKMGWTNFMRRLEGRNKDGFAATAIIEVYEGEVEDTASDE